MKNLSIHHIVVLVGIFGAFNIYAQEVEKPKVAVVLSGGGAKGVAHIPLLQTLDSLGIVPDLIVGTSMGSVVGGFYAMGYSGDSIADITRNANWDKLLGGKTRLKDVGVEEKREFGRYLITLDVKKGKPTISSSIINDQYLREFFSYYSYPVFRIDEFDDLPIAYRSVTTDIVNGEEVVLKDGSLALAMRASMSIPSIFEPIPYKDVLLVDGGIVNNFPVDVAKEWGADIIIGSDVGGGMKPKEDLEGLTNILFQSAMLVSNKKNPESQAMCDILLKHYPNLTYSTGDFKNASEIYAEGKIATAANIHQLVELAKTLEAYDQKTVELPAVTNRIILDTVVYNGISEANFDLVKARMNVETNTPYTINDLEDAVERAMGTSLFTQVDANPILEEDMVGMKVTGREHSPHRLKFAVHFDNEADIGILANYTGRNVIGKSSRLVLTGDISNEPSYRIQYQKQFGKKKRWWMRNELFQSWITQKEYIFGFELNDEYTLRYTILTNEFNKNIKPLESYVGVGLDLYNHRMTPKVDPERDPNAQNLSRYELRSAELYVHYSQNSLDEVFFATRGSKTNLRVARTLRNRADYIAYNPDELDDPALQSYEGLVIGDFTRVLFQYEKRFPITPKMTWIINPELGFMFADDRDPASNYARSEGFEYYFGGNLPNYKRYLFSFYGLSRNEVNAYQFMHLGTSLQINPFSKFYVTPHVDVISAGRGYFDDYIEDAFWPTHKWSDQSLTGASYLYSMGSTLSYNSIIGPVNMDFTFLGGTGNNKLQFYLGLGLFMPVSN